MSLYRSLTLALALLLVGFATLAGMVGLRAQDGNPADKPAIRRPSDAPAVSPTPMIPEPRAATSNEAPRPSPEETPANAQAEPDSTDPESKTEAELEAEAAAANAARMDQFVPIGRVFRGVKIPNYSGDALGSVVHADFMRRADDEHLEMEMLRIVNYNQGEADSEILTDRAIYDIESKTLRSTTPAKIIQTQFEMTGDRMIFDSITRIGHMSGRVKTRIYQVDQFAGTP